MPPEAARKLRLVTPQPETAADTTTNFADFQNHRKTIATKLADLRKVQAQVAKLEMQKLSLAEQQRVIENFRGKLNQATDEIDGLYARGDEMLAANRVSAIGDQSIRTMFADERALYEQQAEAAFDALDNKRKSLHREERTARALENTAMEEKAAKRAERAYKAVGEQREEITSRLKELKSLSAKLEKFKTSALTANKSATEQRKYLMVLEEAFNELGDEIDALHKTNEQLFTQGNISPEAPIRVAHNAEYTTADAQIEEAMKFIATEIKMLQKLERAEEEARLPELPREDITSIGASKAEAHKRFNANDLKINHGIRALEDMRAQIKNATGNDVGELYKAINKTYGELKTLLKESDGAAEASLNKKELRRGLTSQKEQINALVDTLFNMVDARRGQFPELPESDITELPPEISVEHVRAVRGEELAREHATEAHAYKQVESHEKEIARHIETIELVENQLATRDLEAIAPAEAVKIKNTLDEAVKKIRMLQEKNQDALKAAGVEASAHIREVLQEEDEDLQTRIDTLQKQFNLLPESHRSVTDMYAETVKKLSGQQKRMKDLYASGARPQITFEYAEDPLTNEQVLVGVKRVESPFKTLGRLGRTMLGRHSAEDAQLDADIKNLNELLNLQNSYKALIEETHAPMKPVENSIVQSVVRRHGLQMGTLADDENPTPQSTKKQTERKPFDKNEWYNTAESQGLTEMSEQEVFNQNLVHEYKQKLKALPNIYLEMTDPHTPVKSFEALARLLQKNGLLITRKQLTESDVPEAYLSMHTAGYELIDGEDLMAKTSFFGRYDQKRAADYIKSAIKKMMKFVDAHQKN